MLDPIAGKPDQKFLFSANGSSNDVSFIDLATNTVAHKVPAGKGPLGTVAFDH